MFVPAGDSMSLIDSSFSGSGTPLRSLSEETRSLAPVTSEEQLARDLAALRRGGSGDLDMQRGACLRAACVTLLAGIV
jgi:hypothetical protein